MKKEVANLLYEEALANGAITIGSFTHEQDWDQILQDLGYDRLEYTYSTEYIEDIDTDSFTTLNRLRIYEK